MGMVRVSWAARCLRPRSWRAVPWSVQAVPAREAEAARTILPHLCVPKTWSMSCDQVIFVDQASDASLSSDAVIVEMDCLG
jgi:hypothetical protein